MLWPVTTWEDCIYFSRFMTTPPTENTEEQDDTEYQPMIDFILVCISVLLFVCHSSFFNPQRSRRLKEL